MISLFLRLACTPGHVRRAFFYGSFRGWVCLEIRAARAGLCRAGSVGAFDFEDVVSFFYRFEGPGVVN